MANAYFGDQLTWSCPDGDWNNVNNWFSSAGYYDEGDVAGTALGRLPTTADTVYLCAPVTTNLPSTWSGPVCMSGAQGNANYYGAMFSTPARRAGKISGGTWSGAFSGGAGGTNGAYYVPEIAGGTFSGALSFEGMVKISAGTFNGTVTQVPSYYQYMEAPGKISGGTFNGAVVWKQLVGVPNNDNYKWGSSEGISGGTFNSTVRVDGSVISGGTFYGVVTLGLMPLNSNYGSSPVGRPAVINGTAAYLPAKTVSLIKSGGVWTLDPATLPNDPGFAQGGGTFAPRITLAGLPDILGAGL